MLSVGLFFTSHALFTSSKTTPLHDMNSIKHIHQTLRVQTRFVPAFRQASPGGRGYVRHDIQNWILSRPPLHGEADGKCWAAGCEDGLPLGWHTRPSRVRCTTLSGNAGSWTNSDDVKPTGPSLVDRAADQLEAALAREVEKQVALATKQIGRAIKSMQMPTQTLQRGRQPPPKQKSAPKAAPPPNPTQRTERTVVPRVFALTGQARRTTTVRLRMDVGLINTPPSSSPFTTGTFYLAPIPMYGPWYEAARSYRTYRLKSATVSLIPNDEGPMDTVVNGRWLVVGTYSAATPTITDLTQARCYSPVEGSVHSSVSYAFDSGRFGRECDVPKGGFLPTHENTPGSFTIAVSRPSGTGVSDYSALGRWVLQVECEFFDPTCSAERFGYVHMQATGGSGAAPFGTNCIAFGSSGYLQGSTVDVGSRTATLQGTQIGDAIKITGYYDGASTVCTWTAGPTTTNMSAIKLTTFGGVSQASTLTLVSGGTYSRVYIVYYFVVTGSTPTFVMPNTNTLPASSCVQWEFQIIGNNVDETVYNTHVLQSALHPHVGSNGEVGEPVVHPVLDEVASGGPDLNPDPGTPEVQPVPVEPEGQGIGALGCIMPTLVDADVLGDPPLDADAIESIPVEELRAIMLRKRNGK